MNQIFKRMLIITLTLGAVQVNAQTFKVEDIIVGNPSIKYIDPEFFSNGSRMVFYNNTSIPRVWIADLNPLDATLVSANGQDLLVDSIVATLGPNAQTNNGPEWGHDSLGEAVFYSKKDSAGIIQYWRASNLNGNVIRTQLTHVPQGPKGEGAIQGVVRMDVSLPSTMFFYRYSQCPECGGASRWAHETNADAVNNILYYNAAAFAPSFIPGTEDIAVSRFTSVSTSEIFRLKTSSNTYTQISNEPVSDKTSIIAFNAPEYGNELMYAFVADKSELVILRDTGNGYQRFVALVPNDLNHPYMYSPEMFQINGITYFAVLMQDSTDYHTYTDGAIYILGFGNDTANRLVRRIDNGTPGKRLEPEIFIGSEEVFVFFNQPNQLRRARTGIFNKITNLNSDKQQFQNIKIFPNPATSVLYLSGLPAFFNGTVSILNQLGQVIFSEPKHGSQCSVLTGNLSRGIYFIQVKDENANVFTTKFIKE